MKKFLLCLFIVSVVESYAQTDISYNLRKYSMSESVQTDLENSQAYSVRETGALVHWMMSLNDSVDTVWGSLHHQEYNVLRASYRNTNTVGDYLHYDGRRQTFGEVLAGGEYRLPGIGTIYGMASYRNGSCHDMFLNYATHPEDIAPYFVSDTLGVSTMRQEIYTVKGGFSFPLAGWQWGVDASYEGIAQSRTSDPRLSNYSHQMRIGLGGAKVLSHDIFSLRLMPEWSRQSISANGLQDGIRYFEFYGFGLWNHRESQGAITYGRIHTLRGIGTQATWLHAGTWNWTLSSAYRLREMRTEENNFKELFGSTTHLFEQRLLVNRRFAGSELFFQLSAMEQSRSGQENVYEQQVQNAEQGLYDYVKVGTNQLYTSMCNKADFRTKYLYWLSSTSSLSLLGALTWQQQSEKYKSPVMKIQTQTLATMLGIGYQQQCGRLQWQTDLYALQQGGWDNKYSLFGQTTDLQVAMAFTPYQLLGENHQQVGGKFACSYQVDGHHTVGGLLGVDYLKSDYRQVCAVRAGLFLLF